MILLPYNGIVSQNTTKSKTKTNFPQNHLTSRAALTEAKIL